MDADIELIVTQKAGSGIGDNGTIWYWIPVQDIYIYLFIYCILFYQFRKVQADVAPPLPHSEVHSLLIRHWFRIGARYGLTPKAQVSVSGLKELGWSIPSMGPVPCWNRKETNS